MLYAISARCSVTMKCRRRQLSQWEKGGKVKEHVYSQAGNPTTASLKANKDAHYWSVRLCKSQWVVRGEPSVQIYWQLEKLIDIFSLFHRKTVLREQTFAKAQVSDWAPLCSDLLILTWNKFKNRWSSKAENKLLRVYLLMVYSYFFLKIH